MPKLPKAIVATALAQARSTWSPRFIYRTKRGHTIATTARRQAEPFIGVTALGEVQEWRFEPDQNRFAVRQLRAVPPASPPEAQGREPELQARAPESPKTRKALGLFGFPIGDQED